MKHIILIFICSICLSMFSICFSEYYFYTDENGVKHFTENFADVPEQYKSDIHVSESIKPSKTEPPQETPSVKEAEIAIETLTALKETLDTDYSNLVEQKKKWADLKETTDKEEYDALTLELNTKIAAYNKKLAEYDALVEAYNEQVKRLEQN